MGTKSPTRPLQTFLEPSTNDHPGGTIVTVLVGYASKYGATQGIAERIAEKLRASGQDAQALPLASVGNQAGYSRS